MEIAERWGGIYCDTCRTVTEVIVDLLPANDRNSHAGLDLVCGYCRLILATLHERESVTVKMRTDAEIMGAR